MSQSDKSASQSGPLWAWESSSFTTAQNSNADTSIFGQLYSLQDSVLNRLQDFSSTLPEAGPLSAAYRERLLTSLYLLIAATGFGILTILIGLPKLLLRPSKFAILISLTTILAASSVIVLQTPSKFFADLRNGGIAVTYPFLLLCASELITLYATIFIHRYLITLVCAGLQVLALLFYLAQYIPGGRQGLTLLLKAGSMVVWTLIQPFYYIACRYIRTMFN